MNHSTDGSQADPGAQPAASPDTAPSDAAPRPADSSSPESEASPESDATPAAEPPAPEPEPTPEPAAVEMQGQATEETPAVASESPEVPAVEAEAEDAKQTADAATMAEAAAAVPDEPPAPKKGQRFKAKIVSIRDDDTFLDFGGRAEGSIATAELKDEEGQVAFQVGDELHATVKESGDTVVFTLGKKGNAVSLKKIEDAHQAGVPLEGTVKSTNKGGFEVNLAGARAFCPFSQIDLGYCEKPEEFVGKKLPFLVTTFERGGRNVVVSHRRILEAEAAEVAKETRQRLSVGETFEGTVRRLQPYGAFVDIGGLDGLVHVSQIRHGHVKDPKDVLSVGEKVQVKVIKLEGLGTDRERVSLSIKDATPGPWDSIEQELPVGGTTRGKVVRLTDFGAFVELQPGLDGLVHISQISDARIDHPGDVLTVGQEVEAKVLSVEKDSQRISLSLRMDAEPTERRPSRAPRRREESEPLMASSSTPEPEAPRPDVSSMDYDDAVELLKQKFQGR